MNTLVAINRINATIAHIMGKIGTMEKQLADKQPNDTMPTNTIIDEGFQGTSVLDQKFAEFKNSMRNELDNSVKQSVTTQLLDKSASDKLLTDKTIFDLKREMIQEFKKEIAKEKVLIETSVLHQTQGFVSQLVDEKVTASLSKIKEALKAELIEEMQKLQLAQNVPQEPQIGQTVDADFEIQFGTEEPAPKRRTKKKAVA